MADNLKQKTASGMVWTSIQKFTGMGLQFISGIILARLLNPEDFGCIGMLSIFMVVANTFVDGGFGTALIQKKRPTQEDYSTIFFFNFGMSLLMYAILYISAPLIARFYRIPLLSSVLRVQGLVLIINVFSVIQINQLKKQFRFKKIAIVSLLSSAISITLTIIMAYNGYGVWALVAMSLSTAILPATFYWLTNKWVPLLVFSKESLKELFSFGFFMLVSDLIHVICNNIQGLLIGRLYTPSTMGYYSKAKGTEELASTSISGVMGQVVYPLYAEYQNDKLMLANVIKRITCTVAYITFPLMFLLIILAKPIFVILYSDKWLASVVYFQILCLAGLAICLQSLNSLAIAAIGKSKVMFHWTLVKRGLGLCFVVGGLALFGMKGLLVGMVLSSWTIYIINVILVDKYIGYKFFTQFKHLAPIMAMALFSMAVSYSLSLVLSGLHMYIMAAIQLVVFVGVYWRGSVLLKMDSFSYFKENLPLLYNKLGIGKKQ